MNYETRLRDIRMKGASVQERKYYKHTLPKIKLLLFVLSVISVFAFAVFNYLDWETSSLWSAIAAFLSITSQFSVGSLATYPGEY